MRKCVLLRAKTRSCSSATRDWKAAATAVSGETGRLPSAGSMGRRESAAARRGGLKLRAGTEIEDSRSNTGNGQVKGRALKTAGLYV